MKDVLVEVSALAGPAAGRGLGRYVTELLLALEQGGRDVETFTLATRPGRLGELVALGPRQVALARTPHRLLHVPTAYHAALSARSPVVASILDVIPLDVHGHTRTGLKAQLFHRLAGRAGAVLTLSEHARSRIVERLGVPEDRVVVAPLPVTRGTDQGEPLPPGAAGGDYVLAMVDLASVDHRKRAAWLTGVGAALRARGHRLLVVGAGTDDPRCALAATTGLGRVDDATWGALLAGATAFVYSSAYEGQGLPPLEALAAGVPVVAMRNTAVAEVLAGAAVLVAEDLAPAAAAAGPHRPDDAGARRLADALLDLLGDDAARAALRVAGPARAAAFTPAAFRAQVLRANGLAEGR